MTLRSLHPQSGSTSEPPFGAPADEFVDELLVESWWAKSELFWISLTSTKEELRAELQDSVKHIQRLERKLRHISADVEHLLNIEADPAVCADNLHTLLLYALQAEKGLEKRPARKHLKHREYGTAVKHTLRVLRVLNAHGIKASATKDAYFDYLSDAIKILSAIGKEIGLERSEHTWRDIIIEAKRQAADIQ